jgi:hypothetical protein
MEKKIAVRRTLLGLLELWLGHCVWSDGYVVGKRKEAEAGAVVEMSEAVEVREKSTCVTKELRGVYIHNPELDRNRITPPSHPP